MFISADLRHGARCHACQRPGNAAATTMCPAQSAARTLALRSLGLQVERWPSRGPRPTLTRLAPARHTAYGELPFSVFIACLTRVNTGFLQSNMAGFRRVRERCPGAPIHGLQRERASRSSHRPPRKECRARGRCNEEWSRIGARTSLSKVRQVSVHCLFGRG